MNRLNNSDAPSTTKGKTLRTLVGYLMKYAVPLIISVGLCWLLFSKEDFSAMLDTIRNECDFSWIALGLVFNFSAMIARAYRWGIQLRALGIRPPVHALLYSIFGTYAVNLVLPRLGEIWRTGYIAKRQNAPFTTVFGSMVGDRLADTLTVLLIAAGTFFAAGNALSYYFSQNSATLQSIISLLTSPWIWLGVAMMVAAVVMFMRLRSRSRWIVAGQKALRQLWQGFAVLLHMRGRWAWLALTFVIWGTYFFSIYCAFGSFSFTADVRYQYGVTAVLVTFVLSSISMGVPSNGGIGPWQWAVVFALGIYGVPAVKAAAFANVVLGATTMMQILLGIITFIAITLDRQLVAKSKPSPDKTQK